MSVILMRLLYVCIVAQWTVGISVVVAQSNDEPFAPFFDTDSKTDDAKKRTAYSGSITTAGFYFTESADPTVINPEVPIANASPTSRLFSDVRLRLNANHIKGGKYNVKTDIRGRMQFDSCDPRGDGALVVADCLASQSGTFGGKELDIRELHVNYRVSNYELTVGRQFIPEIAAIQFDGIRYHKGAGKRVSYLAFAGLYPMRGARSIGDDYPKVPSVPADPMSASTRLLPVVGGAGVSYRRDKIYGTVGLAGIAPRGKLLDGTSEKARLFVTSTGYFQKSNKTDIFHNLVLDLAGTGGAGLTTIAIGANHRPKNNMILFANVTRVDTETLNVHTQTRLDPPDLSLAAANKFQNNWYVSRVAQESGRLGVSSTFRDQRFELVASGTLRRRPGITLRRNDEVLLVLAKAQAVDINLQFVDRHSFRDIRVGASITRSFDLGAIGTQGEGLNRGKSTSAVLSASRGVWDGRGEFELDLNYVRSEDQSLAEACGVNEIFYLCYGTSKSSLLGAGALLYFRPAAKWFVMGMARAATQTLTTNDIMAGTPTSQPAVLMLTGFAQLGYRF